MTWWRNLLGDQKLASMGQGRIVFARAAAMALIVGIVMVSAMPKTIAPVPQPTAASSAASTDGGANGDDQFLVRDYNELDAGLAPDLPSPDWIGLLFGLVLKLALVVGLIYVGISLLRRYVYRAGPLSPTQRSIAMLQSLNIGPQKTVYILEVGRKLLVVGSTPSQLSLLTEITDPAAVDEVRAQSAAFPEPDQFSTLVNAAWRRFGSSGTPSERK